MELLLSDELSCMLFALLFGVIISVFYDLFRLLRVVFGCGSLLVFLQDLLFFGICAVMSCMFIFTFSGGLLRLYVFGCIIAGAVAWHCTLGRLLMRAAGRVSPHLRAFFHRMTNPIRRGCGAVVSIISHRKRIFMEKTRKFAYEKIKKSRNFEKKAKNLFHFRRKHNIINKGKYGYTEYDRIARCRK